MALPEEGKASPGKAAQNTNIQKPEKREKPLTKVVIRRLPPVIDKETFLNQISPVPSYDYFYLLNGEAALGENSFSRAYINFVNPNDVFGFKEKFDNYVFLDHRGNEYAAVVEFAAFQKVPKKRNKIRVDPKCGSIETDPYYSEFVENLNKPIEPEDKPEYSYQFSTESKDNKGLVTTPLLEFVKNRRAERMRIREERREERRRKELERKKIREEEKKKRLEEKSPTKVFSKAKVEDKETSDTEVKEEKRENTEYKSDKYYEKSGSFKNKEKKFDDRKKDVKVKPSPRKEFPEKREYKNRKDYFKESKYETYKKEEKQFPKKVKKYSEKREERKLEAQRAEMKKSEEQQNKPANVSQSNKDLKNDKGSEVGKSFENLLSKKGSQEILDKTSFQQEKESIESISNEVKSETKLESSLRKHENESKVVKKARDSVSPKEINSKYLDDEASDYNSKETKESTKESRRERIRNKDRPTIAIYRPGMLSRRKLAEADTDKETTKEVVKEEK